MRTPMNGVIAVADLLAHEPITPKQHELVALIQSSGRMLDRVLRDLLDIAQIEAGVLEIIEAPFDVATAVNEVVQMFAAEAAAKDIAIEFHAMPLTNGQAIGDADRLKQILANLVANAVKFTEKGRVDIALANLGDMTVFTVADTGIGFDPAYKERLFNRFEQADGSITRRFGGAGLGLAIARDIAVRMGGALTCDSTPGSGSVFFLTLPLRAASNSEPALAAIPALEAREDAAPHILVVDDGAANRQVLSLILDSAGVVTTTAENGLEAVTCWRDANFDAVLMDIQMPVMDGLTAVQTIRQAERSEGRQRTPILMVSANAMPEHIRASLAAGADGHLAKPITAERLFAALSRMDEGAPVGDAQCAA
jgi:CheY-like chemotaxis protein/anti-sigma regulatory factor (Ser/Thr protein kinase)